MVKRRNGKGRPFKKGQKKPVKSGKKRGVAVKALAAPSVPREIKEINHSVVYAYLNETVQKTQPELVDIMLDPKALALPKAFATLMVGAIGGNREKMDFILDRLVGKVPLAVVTANLKDSSPYANKSIEELLEMRKKLDAENAAALRLYENPPEHLRAIMAREVYDITPEAPRPVESEARENIEGQPLDGPRPNENAAKALVS